jgi:hypothetical protein
MGIGVEAKETNDRLPLAEDLCPNCAQKYRKLTKNI